MDRALVRPKIMTEVVRETKVKRSRRRRGRNRQRVRAPARQRLRGDRTALSKIIDAKIDADHEAIQLGEAGLAYINLCTNPFGDGTSMGPRGVAVRRPDADSTTTFVLVETGSYVTPAGVGAATGGHLVQLTGWNSGANTFQLTYGADPMSGSAVMTTVVESNPPSSTIIAAVCPSGTQLRVLAAGLRANAISPAESNSGTFDGFASHFGLRTAVATYNANHYCTDDQVNVAPYPISDGITVRKRHLEYSHSYVLPLSVGYWAGTVNTYGEMPVIRTAGISATTVIRYDWVVVYEVVGRASCSPFPIVDSKLEPDLPKIDALISDYPLAASGHSFKDFVKQVMRAGVRLGRFVYKNRDNIITLSKGLVAALP